MRSSLSATVFAISATAVAQVSLNAWNGPFYEAIAQRNFSAFLYQLLVFAAIAAAFSSSMWRKPGLREMIKLKSREWLTRDLFGEWLKPGRPTRLAGAGEIGVNPDQRIHEDARRLTELSADLGIGLLQASLLLLCFLGVLWTVAGAARHFDLRRQSPSPGLHGVVCASLRCERFVARLACWPPPRGFEFPAALSAKPNCASHLFESVSESETTAQLSWRGRGEAKARSRSREGPGNSASDCLRYRQAHLDHCRIRMDFNCRSNRHRVARIFQRQALPSANSWSWLAHSLRLTSRCVGLSITSRCLLNGARRSSE